MTMHAYAGLGAPDAASNLPSYSDFIEDDTYSRIFGYVFNAAGGYFVGRALAPQKDDAMTYALIGSVVGALTGPFGLGVFGFYSLSKRDE